MPRRCGTCREITPRESVNFCPHCGAQFPPPADRPARLPPSTLRPSSVVRTERRVAPDHTSVRVRRPSSSSLDRSTSCEYQALCREYLASLQWHERYFDRQHDHCYCDRCHSKSSSDTLNVGGSIYVVPRGWCRFGLHVDEVLAQTEHIWSQWIVTYHGTSAAAAKSIVAHRQFLTPGDTALDGSVIRIPTCHIPGKAQIYTSPTIAYSSLPTYCVEQEFRSKLNNKRYAARLVLQCRQKPGTFKVQGETINARGKRLCPFIHNAEIEIFTEVRAAVVPYGVLIHLAEI